MAIAQTAVPQTVDRTLLQQTQRKLNKLIGAGLLHAPLMNTQGVLDENTLTACRLFRGAYGLDQAQPGASYSFTHSDIVRDLQPTGTFAQVLQLLVDRSEGAISVMSNKGVCDLAQAMMPTAPKRHAPTHNMINNISKYAPPIRDAFLREFGCDHTGMLLMAFATVWVETGSFQPLDEGENWGHSQNANANKYNNSAYQAFDVYEPEPKKNAPAEQKTQWEEAKVSGMAMRQEKKWPAPVRAPGRAAASIGNDSPGDGARFKGRGLIQLTGKENYKKAKEHLQIDLLSHPELVTTNPAVSTGALVWFLTQRENYRHLQPALATNDTSTMRKLVNGGNAGQEDFDHSYWAGKRHLNHPAYRPGKGFLNNSDLRWLLNSGSFSRKY